MKIMKRMFIAVDGDDVGRKLELYILDNNINELEDFTLSLTNRFNWFVTQLYNLIQIEIHLVGGDSILASFEPNKESIEYLEKLRTDFEKQGLPTISIGIGYTPREAYFALKYAKLYGKNCLVIFEDIKNSKKEFNIPFLKN